MCPVLTCPYCKSSDIILPDQGCLGWDAHIDMDYEYYEVLECMCYDCLREFIAKRYYTITKIDYEEVDKEEKED